MLFYSYALLLPHWLHMVKQNMSLTIHVTTSISVIAGLHNYESLLALEIVKVSEVIAILHGKTANE